MQRALHVAQAAPSSGNSATAHELHSESIVKSIKEIEDNIVPKLKNKNGNTRWMALKLLEGDENVHKTLEVPNTLLTEIKSYQEKLEKKYDMGGASLEGLLQELEAKIS